MLKRLKYFYRVVRMRPRRYRHLLRAVYRARARTIVEIGVFDGKQGLHARHAVDTIRFDWERVTEIMSDTTVVIFDDYYENSEPEVEGVGCRSIIEGLDRDDFDIEMLSPQDSFQKEWGTQHTRMILVTKRRTDGPPS